MQRYLFNTALRSRLAIRRTYASFSPSISVQAHQVDHLVSQVLPGTTSITLSTQNSWPKWNEVRDAPELHEHHDVCKGALSTALKTLKSLSTINRIAVPLKDILDLPLIQSGVDQTAPTDHNRSPVTIFSNIGIPCSCIDLGLWKLENFPAIEIIDAQTREACLQGREFDDIDAWHAHLSNQGDHLLQAFDFTADFHSRDLTSSLNYEAEKTWIDLLPHGQGYARIEDVDVDKFSVTFADDLAYNVEYFRTQPWRPGIYDSIMDEHNRVSSKLQDNGKRLSDVAKLKISVPTWQLSEKTRAWLIDKLDLKEDEEAYFEEWTISKRKKA